MEKIGILGGDRRMACLAALLAADGHDVLTWGTEDAPGAAELGEAVAADRVVLPVPTARDGRLNGTALPLGELWTRLGAAGRVYAAALPEEELRRAKALGVRLTDYFADEALTTQGAVATAEGALALAMERLPVTLCGTPCLVLGFGRIGKLLSARLRALGARTAVAARKASDRVWIEASGCEALSMDALPGRLGKLRAVFNTVPAPVLGEVLLRELPRDCLLLELASRPGFDRERARALGLDCLSAPGLPGRFAPESAALAIREALYRLWDRE